MNSERFGFGPGRKAWLAAAAAALLAIGATVGSGVAAAVTQAAQARTGVAQATTSDRAQPAIAHAIGDGRDSYADIVKIVAPAVVTIRTEGKAKVSPTAFDGDDNDLLRRFFGDQFGNGGGGDQRRAQPRTFRQQALGSGVLVSKDGYILTNNHVIDGADNIQVDLTDGRTLKAKVIGTDKPSDLALLKIDGSDFHVIGLANSDGVQVGDVALAVGNPLGLGQTVTMGIISAKGRHTDVGDGSYEDFLQTDAPINRGNSGGALVNTKGELIGINSQIASVSEGNIGIGFAIPANMAKHVMDELKGGGRVHRAQLGVTIQPVTSEMADSLGLKNAGGVIVSSVEPGSAADHAGVKRGDVISSFNGESVHDLNALRNRVADLGPGANATFVVVRDGSERTLKVTLDEAAASKTAARDAGPADREGQSALGLTVAPLTPETARRGGVPKDAHGVVVQDVDPSGRAADAGIQPGDVIQEINRRPVQGVDDLRAAARASADKPLLLLITRDGRDLYVTVRPS